MNLLNKQLDIIYAVSVCDIIIFYLCYVKDKLNDKDKYGYFLGGNNPLIIIENENAASQAKLLIIRDNHSDSMAPFFSQEFSEVHLMDLRYFRESVSNYAADNPPYYNDISMKKISFRRRKASEDASDQ